MQRTPPLVRIRVELGVARGDGFLNRARELVPQTHESRTLLLALCFEPLRVGRDSRLGIGDELALPSAKLGKAVADVALETIEIRHPALEASVDLPLCVCE